MAGTSLGLVIPLQERERGEESSLGLVTILRGGEERGELSWPRYAGTRGGDGEEARPVPLVHVGRLVPLPRHGTPYTSLVHHAAGTMPVTVLHSW